MVPTPAGGMLRASTQVQESFSNLVQFYFMAYIRTYVLLLLHHEAVFAPALTAGLGGLDGWAAGRFRCDPGDPREHSADGSFGSLG